MPAHQAVVERYIEGFRRGDHAQVLACLADDVVWVLHGHRAVRGKAAFQAEIATDMFDGTPTLEVFRSVEQGDAVAVFGGGSVTRKNGDIADFAFSELFVFSGDRIVRIETYHVWTAPTPAL
jgi:ketosteroid isomerase-like protein